MVHIERLHNLCSLPNKITLIHTRKRLTRLAADTIRFMTEYKIRDKRIRAVGKSRVNAEI